MTTEITDRVGVKDVSKIIDSDSFRPTGKNIGYGCWGRVDLYKDEAGTEWAIKYFHPDKTGIKQMKDRGWNEETVMRKEGISLDSAAYNIVPRLIERDKGGKLFVAMPYFEEGDLRSHIKKLNIDGALNVARDIATALKYYHTMKVDPDKKDKYSGKPVIGQAHGDVKPANILMKKGRANLSDLGSSTCITMGGKGSIRGPHGEINYRALESFDESASPSARADVWSLGAILYEAIVGEGIYDGVLNPESITQKIVNRKIRKKIPRNLRKYLKECLAVESWDRFKNGEEALSQLEKTIESRRLSKTFKKHRAGIFTIAGALTLMGLGAYLSATHEPKEIKIPIVNQQYMTVEDLRGQQVIFEKEDLSDLPRIENPDPVERMALDMTNNKNVASLLKAYFHSLKRYGMFNMLDNRSFYNETMAHTWINYTTSDERSFTARNREQDIIAKCIEVGIAKAQTPKGTVDLEDACAIARLGLDKVNQARYAVNSRDFADYINAKDSDGNPIISKNEQDFLKTWIATIHSEN